MYYQLFSVCPVSVPVRLCISFSHFCSPLCSLALLAVPCDSSLASFVLPVSFVVIRSFRTYGYLALAFILCLLFYNQNHPTSLGLSLSARVGILIFWYGVGTIGFSCTYFFYYCLYAYTLCTSLMHRFVFHCTSIHLPVILCWLHILIPTVHRSS